MDWPNPSTVRQPSEASREHVHENHQQQIVGQQQGYLIVVEPAYSQTKLVTQAACLHEADDDRRANDDLPLV